MKTRKAINFDLSTNDLKKFFKDTREPYNQIKEFMLENGFEHRQYSGYVSKEPTNEKSISKIAEKMSRQFSWLGSCVKEFDVTDIGEQHSLKDLITNHSKDVHKNLDVNKKEHRATAKKIESIKAQVKEIAKNLQNNRATNLSKNNKDIEL